MLQLVHMEAPPPPQQDYQMRNPVAHKKHNRQVLMQISLPLGIAFILLVALGIFTGLGTDAAGTSKVADTALVFLATQAIVIGLFLGLFVVVIIYLVFRIQRGLPGIAWQTLIFIFRVDRRLRHMSNSAVEPFLRWRSVQARLSRLKRLVPVRKQQ